MILGSSPTDSLLKFPLEGSIKFYIYTLIYITYICICIPVNIPRRPCAKQAAP